MGQPSTSAQIRAVALKEAVASLPLVDKDFVGTTQVQRQEAIILRRAEKFASYIEHGEEVDPNA